MFSILRAFDALARVVPDPTHESDDSCASDEEIAGKSDEAVATPAAPEKVDPIQGAFKEDHFEPEKSSGSGDVMSVKTETDPENIENNFDLVEGWSDVVADQSEFVKVDTAPSVDDGLDEDFVLVGSADQSSSEGKIESVQELDIDRA